MKSGIVILLINFLSGIAEAQSPFKFGFSTLVGGKGYEQVRDVVTDSEGNIYVTGGTSSEDFVVTIGEPLKKGGERTMDIFLRKYAPDGKLVWSTLLGGDEYDRAYAIEVDVTGNVYIAGRAGKNLPVSEFAFQTAFGGDEDPNPLYGKQDGFVAKYSTDGALIWCSYFGGNDRGFIRDIALDAQGNIFIVETETSDNNPHISKNAFQRQNNGGYDAVISKISNDGKTVIWATWLGGTKDDFFGPSIRVTASGQVVVIGTVLSMDIQTTPGCLDSTLSGESDIFIAKISMEGTKLLFATYFGGSGIEGTETHNLALDKCGNIIIAATTSSEDFMVSENAFQSTYGGSGKVGSGKNTNYPFDAFITILSNNGDTIIASTYFGGKNGEAAEGVGLDEKGNIYVTGATFSNDLSKVFDHSHQQTNMGGGDAYFVCLNPLLTHVIFFSFLGASGADYGRALHVDHNGVTLIAGETSSQRFPSSEAALGFGGLDGFLASFKPLNEHFKLRQHDHLYKELENPCK